MRLLLSLLALLLSLISSAQKRQCGCKTDTLLNKNTTDCKTTLLKNGTKLYWQFTCDAIWLTLELKNGKKVVLDNYPVELYAYLYRLGYSLEEEFDKTLLFRSGCAANGPCDYYLIDKNTGVLKDSVEDWMLIRSDDYRNVYDFTLTIDSNNNCVLRYFDTDKVYTIPIRSKYITYKQPPYSHFHEIGIKNNIVTAAYDYYLNGINGKDTISINLKRYPK